MRSGFTKRVLFWPLGQVQGERPGGGGAPDERQRARRILLRQLAARHPGRQGCAALHAALIFAQP